MLKTIAFAAAAAMVMSIPAQSQITLVKKSMGIGQGGSGTFEFVTGAEALVIQLNLRDDILVGSGYEGQFNTLGSVPDTEIAVYNSVMNGLWACNDDGAGGTWGDPGFSSLLPFGDGEIGDGTQFAGSTDLFNPCPENLDLTAGRHLMCVATYSTYWAEVDARTTVTGSDTGLANVELFFQ